MLITQVYKKKRVTLSYHTEHATIGNALVKTCFWSATTTFLIFKRWYSADRKNCILLPKTFFWLSDCIFAYSKNLKSGSPGLPVESVRAFSVSSLTWTSIYNAHWVFFLSFFDYLIILRISWDKTLSMSTLTNYSQHIQFSFFHRMIRRACAHAVSKEPSTTIDIK